MWAVKAKEVVWEIRQPLSDSAGIQTRNLLIRSQMLYSVELRSHSFSLQLRCFLIAMQRYTFSFNLQNYFKFFLPFMSFFLFFAVFGHVLEDFSLHFWAWSAVLKSHRHKIWKATSMIRKVDTYNTKSDYPRYKERLPTIRRATTHNTKSGNPRYKEPLPTYEELQPAIRRADT